VKAQDVGGALICNAGGAAHRANASAPPGPSFFSPSWRGLDRPVLREADRVGREMSLECLGGWNPEGPMLIDSGRLGPVTPGTVDFCE
jgi:hypothetical protein